MKRLPRNPASSPPLVGITGPSGSGKTTLIVGLIRELRGLGLRVAALKHASKGFEMDRRGKDTWRMKEAGAREVAAVGAGGLALIADASSFGAESAEPDPLALASLLFRGVDLVLAEGFSFSASPRVEVLGKGRRPAAPGAGELLAVVGRGPRAATCRAEGVPFFQADDVHRLAGFLLERLGIAAAAHSPAKTAEGVLPILEAEATGGP